MSVPPDMLARLKQQPAAMPGGGSAGPAGSPMATPQKKEGSREIARVKIHVAMNMLESALPQFGAESKEGKAILKHLLGLAREFGDTDSSDLVPAQIKQMVGDMPQMGGGNAQQQAIAKMMQGNRPAQIPGPRPPMPMPTPQ